MGIESFKFSQNGWCVINSEKEDFISKESFPLGFWENEILLACDSIQLKAKSNAFGQGVLISMIKLPRYMYIDFII